MSRREREKDRDRDRERDRERDRRDSDPKRRRSGFDRELSPKRSRRDGKPEIERVSKSNLENGDHTDRDQRNHRKSNLENSDHTDRDQRNHRQLQDALPLKAPLESDRKIESDPVTKESDKTINGQVEGRKNVSDPTEVPQSRSYFQRNERDTAGQVGRSFNQKATEHRSRDSKDEQHKRTTKNSGALASGQREGKSETRRNNNGNWSRDGFLKLEAEPPSPVRKRPPFREKKIPVDKKTNSDKATATTRIGYRERSVPTGGKRDEREYNPRLSDRSERPASRSQGEVQKHSLQPRERFGAAAGVGNYRGRDGFNGREGYGPSGRVEKWKHDLFEEANKSPTIKNEDDQIAKVEALLAS